MNVLVGFGHIEIKERRKRTYSPHDNVASGMRGIGDIEELLDEFRSICNNQHIWTTSKNGRIQTEGVKSWDLENMDKVNKRCSKNILSSASHQNRHYES